MAIRGNFFAEKREWSKLKDQILNEYLTPYLTKILKTGRPTRITDCFAGKGQFDDGTPGSPLIIARHIAAQLSRNPGADIRGIFIERKYAADLRANLATSPNCEVLPDDYEHCVQHFLSQPRNTERNYFFYVDPYGIKSLDFAYFQALKAVGFRSLEILLNLNTTGFLREGCRLLNLAREVPDWAAAHDYESDGKNTPARMDAIAGGDYWQASLEAFNRRAFDFHEAEERFTASYTDRLKAVLPLVVHVPIKERASSLPKYRLIFATNHPEGLFLMADTMHKAWQSLLAREHRGQLFLFSDEQLGLTTGPSIEAKVWSSCQTTAELPDLLVALIQRHGIAHSTGEYVDAIRKHEGELFDVQRIPAATATGRKARHFNYGRARILVQRLPTTENLL